MSKKKVCIMGDNLNYTTGNARVIKELSRGLAKLPFYDVSHIAIGPDDIEQKEKGVKFLPVQEGGFDDASVFKFLEKISQYIKREKFDYIIILGDAINYQKRGIGNLNMKHLSPKTKVIFWETVDSNSRLCMEQGYCLRNARSEIYGICDKVVATAHYGKDVLEAEMVKVDKVIWEFADTDKFFPIDKKKRDEIRKEYRLKTDDFILLMVGRNIRRKNNELAFRALYPLMLKHEDLKVFCLIPDFRRDDDNDLVDYIKRVLTKKYGRDLMEEGQIIFCTSDGKTPIRLMEGVTDNEIVRFHQLSDAFISATSNEGFNLNYGEALAVGHPYVGIANTTLPELSEDGKFAYMAPIDFEFNVGSGIEISTCKHDTLTKYIEMCYEDWNLKYSKQNELIKLKADLFRQKLLKVPEEEIRETELKITNHKADKTLEQTAKIKSKQGEKEALVKHIQDTMTRGKCIAEWHKFLKSIDEGK